MPLEHKKYFMELWDSAPKARGMEMSFGRWTGLYSASGK
jgi:hypothetical protein